MAVNDAIEINNHSEKPSTNGFQPADLIFCRDKPAPIKNKVNTNIDLATVVSVWVSTTGKGKQLLSKAAPMKRKMNQGIFIF